LLLLDQAWWTTGHHRIWLEAFYTRLAERGWPYAAATAAAPAVAASPLLGYRSSARVARRRHLVARLEYRRALEWGRREFGCETLVDLNLELSLRRMGHPLSRYPRRVGVLHELGRLGAPAPTGRSRARRALERRAIRRYFGPDAGTVVVHTWYAHDVVASLGGHAVRLSPPVHRLPPPPTAYDSPFILFVGRPRPDKPLAPLIRASEAFAPDVELWVAGIEATGQASERRWLRALGVVDDEELSALFHSAAATVLPYNDRYRTRGASSAVLLQAVAAGSPVVIPRWLVSQVPVGYEAVFAYDDERAELTAALGRALGRRPTHRGADQKAGAAALGEEHTFERYIDRVLTLLDHDGR